MDGFMYGKKENLPILLKLTLFISYKHAVYKHARLQIVVNLLVAISISFEGFAQKRVCL